MRLGACPRQRAQAPAPARQRDRQRAVGDAALDLALDIVGELAGAGLGEIDAVAGPQAADLAFEIRSLRGESAAVVDEAVPDVDIDDAGLLGALADRDR